MYYWGPTLLTGVASRIRSPHSPPGAQIWVFISQTQSPTVDTLTALRSQQRLDPCSTEWDPSVLRRHTPCSVYAPRSCNSWSPLEDRDAAYILDKPTSRKRAEVFIIRATCTQRLSFRYKKRHSAQGSRGVAKRVMSAHCSKHRQLLASSIRFFRTEHGGVPFLSLGEIRPWRSAKARTLPRAHSRMRSLLIRAFACADDCT
ncbi:hypothetical protein OF83DRAFT_10960 [Amylostereum chailletii]|nr:hypothetical protein OF83DRAFT_10960 [Amylostereum chailletii]